MGSVLRHLEIEVQLREEKLGEAERFKLGKNYFFANTHQMLSWKMLNLILEELTTHAVPVSILVPRHRTKERDCPDALADCMELLSHEPRPGHACSIIVLHVGMYFDQEVRSHAGRIIPSISSTSIYLPAGKRRLNTPQTVRISTGLVPFITLASPKFPPRLAVSPASY